MLLIGFLGSTSLADVSSRARAASEAKSTTDVCPLTGRETFRGALAAILANLDLATRVQEIRVSPTYSDSQIEFGRKKPSAFMGKPPDELGHRIVISLQGSAIIALARAVANLADDHSEGE
jgi:hypothetical protein